MNKLRLLTLITLLTVAVIGTAAYAKKKQGGTIFTPKAHHVIYAEWKVDKAGAKTLSSIRVRDVEESGAWKEWTANKAMDRTGLNDHTDPAKPGNFSPGAKFYKSPSFFRSLPHFVREENILGIQCFTLDVKGAHSTFSPEYGMTPLRVVINPGGEGTIIEALKIY